MKECEEKINVQCVGWTLEQRSQCEGLVHGGCSVWKEGDNGITVWKLYKNLDEDK